jgi:hypothetical protein
MFERTPDTSSIPEERLADHFSGIKTINSKICYKRAGKDLIQSYLLLIEERYGLFPLSLHSISCWISYKPEAI